MSRGRFITVEGVDGAGKSTQIVVIEETLRSRGIDLVTTREPGGPETAEKIREILLNDKMGAQCELLLMFAARAENLEKIVRPALNAGKWVLCDRFTDASYAYQGYGRGYDLKEIEVLERLVHADLKPDRTVLFDVPTVIAAARLQRSLDRFEKESQDFHRRVRAGYLELAAKEPDRFYVVDGTRPASEISEQLRKEFGTWI